jgi:hypothetical protein
MASAAGVTEVTIRNRIRSLVKDLNLATVYCQGIILHTVSFKQVMINHRVR